jgi:hypothetical protein
MSEDLTVRGLCPVCGEYTDLVPVDHAVPVLRGMVGYHHPLVWRFGDPPEWCLGSGEPPATD